MTSSISRVIFCNVAFLSSSVRTVTSLYYCSMLILLVTFDWFSFEVLPLHKLLVSFPLAASNCHSFGASLHVCFRFSLADGISLGCRLQCGDVWTLWSERKWNCYTCEDLFSMSLPNPFLVALCDLECTWNKNESNIWLEIKINWYRSFTRKKYRNHYKNL